MTKPRSTPPHPPHTTTTTDVDVWAIDIGAQDLRTTDGDDDMLELAADLARRGLLQPIGVHRTDNARFQLRWGKRRLTAARTLGWPTIPTRIVEAGSQGMEDDALAENLHRRPLTIEEEVRAVTNLHTPPDHSPGRSPAQIAALLSKSREWVMRRLTIPNLPDDLRPGVLDGDISIGAAEALALLDNAGDRALLLAHARSTGATVPQLRQAVTEWREARRLSDTQNTAPPEPHALFQPATIVHVCARCHTPQPEASTLILRVCADGCAAATDPHAQEAATNGS